MLTTVWEAACVLLGGYAQRQCEDPLRFSLLDPHVQLYLCPDIQGAGRGRMSQSHCSSAWTGLSVCNSTQGAWVWPLGREDPMEKGMATHSGILAWRSPWTEEPGRLYSPWGHKESDSTEQLTDTRSQSLAKPPQALIYVDLYNSKRKKQRIEDYSKTLWLMKLCITGTFLIVQWLRIHFPMQGCGFDVWSGN